MNLPPYQTTTRSAAQRELLRQWLAERNLDLVLREATAPDGEAAPSLRYERTRRTTPVAARAGDVVIARPSVRGGWGPLYLALLDQLPDQRWHAVPFSRYSVPAVPGEWRTGLDTPALRVLCFWNVRAVEPARLLPGVTCRLPRAQFARIRIIAAELDAGPLGTSGAAKGFGPPLVHPADPRYDYLAEERVRVEDHLASAAWPLEKTEDEDGELSGQIIPFEAEPAGKPAWLLAAEGRPTYGAD